MYKRRIRNLCVLLVLVMLLELTPVQLLGNWVQRAQADEIPEEYRGFEFEIPQESENGVDVEAPPTFVDSRDETSESVTQSSDPLVLDEMTDLEQSDEEMSTLAEGTTEDDEVTDPFLGAPYFYNSGKNENVSLNSGTLSLDYTDYVLPGKNGLDLVIGRQYNSEDASLRFSMLQLAPSLCYTVSFYSQVERIYPNGASSKDEKQQHPDLGPLYFYEAAEAAVDEWEGTEDYTDQNNVIHRTHKTASISSTFLPNSYIKRNTHYNKLYGLGYGWRFQFSSIETRGVQEYLHLSNGTTYAITKSSNSKLTLRGYNLLDLNLYKVNSLTDNSVANAQYYLAYKDGKKEYFNSSGQLICIKDRYDNAITLEHSWENGYPKITIIDTLGREIVISGQSSSSGHTVTVALPENITLTYEIEHYEENQEVQSLSLYTDPAGNTTQYSYDFVSGDLGIINVPAGENHINEFLNLSTVTHPTGAQTVYSYEKVMSNVSNSKTAEVYRIASRADWIGETEYNRQAYIYSENDHTGHPAHKNPNNLPSSFTYHTTVTDANGVSTTARFDNYHQQTKVEVCKGTQKIQTIEYIYNYYSLPIKETTYTYSPTNQTTPMISITSKEYDVRGNVTESWSTLAEGNEDDTEHTINSYYNSAYGLLWNQTYKLNATTTVTLENTLDSSQKHIIKSEIYVNDVLTQRTEYDYDSYGNIIKQRHYHDDMQTYDEFEYTYSNGAYLSQEKFGALVLGSYAYDTLGRMTSHTDGNGNTTLYAYDALGNVTQITHPDNTTVTYARDYPNNALTVTNENGVQVKYTYTPLGLEYETIDVQTGAALSRKEYDTQSRLSKLSEYVYGSVTQYAYDDLGRLTCESIWQADTVLSDTRYAYDDAVENGAYRKVTKTVVGDSYAPNVVTTEYTDKHGNLVKTGRFLNGTEYFDTYTYDYVGNLLTQKTAADAQKSLPYTVKYEYNENNQIVKTYNSANQYTTNTYNALGQLTASTDYAGTPTTYTYDGLGRLLSQTITVDEGETVTTRYEYDGCGNIIREWKPVQAVGETEQWAKTDYSYNSRGRLILVEQYDGDAVASSTSYTYDGVGNLLTMSAGGNTTTYTYNKYGGMLTEQDAMGQTVEYIYSSTGRPLYHVTRNKAVIYYGYDSMGRLLSTTAGNDHIYRSFTATGQVRTEESNWQRTSYTYDSLGRVTTISEQELSVTDGSTSSTDPLIFYTKQYSYDLSDNRTGFTLVKGTLPIQNVTYTYDDLNRLTTVTEGGTLRATYTYDTNGNRASLTYPNGAVESYTYNKANWITGLTNAVDGETISSFAYTYYASGSQKSETDHTGKVTAYTYDDLGRLVTEADGATVYTYAYDSSGNRTSLTVTGDEPYSVQYTYNANNRLIMEARTEGGSTYRTAYSYDANGNLTQKYAQARGNVASTNEILQYNSFDQLTGLTINSTSSAYAYNAQGIRTSKRTSGLKTGFLLDGGNVVCEYQSSGALRIYLRGINLICQKIGTAVNYYLFNAHGDVVDLVNTAGAVTQSYDYDAFGVEKDPDPLDTNHFRYCGEYLDAETGRYYLRARYYDPLIGRFTQRDTHWNTANMIYGDNPQKINEREDKLGLKTYSYAPQISAIMQAGNLYVYGINNPVWFSDPSGNVVSAILLAAAKYALPVLISATLGGVVGGLFNYSQGLGFWNGFAGGAVSGTVQYLAILGLGPIGAIIGGAAGAFGGTYITGVLNGSYESKDDLIAVSLISALFGGICGIVTAGVISMVDFANLKGSIVPELMQYSPQFGKLLENFFSTIDDAVSYDLSNGAVADGWLEQKAD